jgi:hypothetical protein
VARQRRLRRLLGGTVKLLPAGDGTADLSVEASAKSLRAGLAAGRVSSPARCPDELEVKLQRGLLAAAAGGGRTEGPGGDGPGKVKSGLVGMLGAASSASSPRS